MADGREKSKFNSKLKYITVRKQVISWQKKENKIVVCCLWGLRGFCLFAAVLVFIVLNKLL